MRRPAFPIVSAVLPAVLVVVLGSGAAVAQDVPEAEASADSALVAVQPSRPEPRARDLRIGREARGSLDARDATDDQGRAYEPWRLRLAAGQRVVIDLISEDFDTRVAIGRGTGADFEVLGENDDGPDGTDSRLTFTAPEAGDYLVRAGAFAEASGRYTLTVDEAPPPPTAEPIAVGETRDGVLEDGDARDDLGNRHDLWRLRLIEGQRVAVSLSAGEFDAYLVAGRDGTSGLEDVVEDDDGAGEGTNSRLSITPEAAGDWLIHARGLSAEALGPYELRVESIAPDPEPVALTAADGVVQGEISEGDATGDGGRRFDAYRVTGAEGRRMRAIMRSGDFDSYLEIGEAGEAFTPLAGDDDGLGEGTDSRLDFTFPTDGDYILRASPLSSSEEGLYSLELLDRGLPPAAGSILVGATVRGALDEDSATNDMNAAYDDYAVRLEAGQKLRLTMVSNAFDAYLAIARAEETEAIFMPLASDDDGLSDTHSLIEITIEEGGDYVIRAAALAAGQTGDYVLTVEAAD
ncbi:PPC domain-containing protein [Brevundimonas lutea]|uniref:PPC domain-containing protein n=1 Tax=Brevundimonas lutea TaxID=2293980 RepID=UPI000F01BD54|nr:PPC domain-containing protein [Brevundimonas lutea]